MENLLKNILEEANIDPELKNTIDIEEILEKEEQFDYLKGKTIQSITEEIFEKINGLNLSPDPTKDQERKKEWCDKLIGYRFISELYELHKGKLVKNITKSEPPMLQMKGKMVNVKFLNNGTHIVCMLGRNRYSQYLFSDYLTFQKLSLEEQVILQANEFLRTIPPSASLKAELFE